ncbi:MFS transporter [Chelativorans sp. AA-79]|uniref:MFS transporter n=1 Tax=Chelativorans sp. AA-79 TaxID=3028735 RepID=UPI0023F8EC59|nr:MFS transporter [Chelativorans sp. AA-79]WEX09140.1 MFS transporter [Chelativorans sp. AA-79]
MEPTGIGADTQRPWRSILIAITCIQAILALTTRVLPLFAIPLTTAAGVSATSAGQMAAATSFGSMIFFLWGPRLVSRLSSLRQLQVGALLSGLAVLLCLNGEWTIILVAAFFIGLGYGPSAPAGSDILMRATPERRRGLAFSIKQAGVPLGGLVAGLALPMIAINFGLPLALWIAAGTAAAGALGLALWRGNFEEAMTYQNATGRRKLVPLIMAPAAMLELVATDAKVRRLVAVSFGLGSAQGILLAYFPVLLGEQKGYSVASAGAAFAVLQIGGIVGRVFAGWLADWLRGGIAMLLWLCISSGFAMLALSAIGPTTSAVVIIAISAIAGATVISWNGVFMSELARISPVGRVVEMTSAATFVLFAGYVASPLIAQWIFSVAGYGFGLAVAAAMPFAAALLLIVASPFTNSERKA